MKTIFDCETEIGTWEQDWPHPNVPKNGDGEVWRIYAHTKAALTRAQGMLKIEQRCFLRLGQEVSDYPNMKPGMMLESALDTEEQSVAMVQQAHQQFIDRARQQIADGCPA